jgi:hypothetical protein
MSRLWLRDGAVQLTLAVLACYAALYAIPLLDRSQMQAFSVGWAEPLLLVVVLVACEDIVRSTQRGSELTRQLLAFSRKQVLEKEIIDLGEVLSGSANVLRGVTGEKIDLVISPGHASIPSRATAVSCCRCCSTWRPTPPTRCPVAVGWRSPPATSIWYRPTWISDVSPPGAMSACRCGIRAAG